MQRCGAHISLSALYGDGQFFEKRVVWFVVPQHKFEARRAFFCMQFVENPQFRCSTGLDVKTVLHQAMLGLDHLHSLKIGKRLIVCRNANTVFGFREC